MKNRKISLKAILIILLLGIIVALILINLNDKNYDIAKQEIKKDQLEETTNDNTYIKMSTHLEEVENVYNDIMNNLPSYGLKRMSRLITQRTGAASFPLSEYNLEDTDPSHYIIVITSSGRASVRNNDTTTWYVGSGTDAYPTISISNGIMSITNCTVSTSAYCNTTANSSKDVTWKLYYIGSSIKPIIESKGSKSINISDYGLTDTDASHYFVQLTSKSSTSCRNNDTTTWYQSWADGVCPKISISGTTLSVTGCTFSVGCSCNSSNTASVDTSWKLYYFDPDNYKEW